MSAQISSVQLKSAHISPHDNGVYTDNDDNNDNDDDSNTRNDNPLNQAQRLSPEARSVLDNIYGISDTKRRKG